jgi:hypothetical protein
VRSPSLAGVDEVGARAAEIAEERVVAGGAG